MIKRGAFLKRKVRLKNDFKSSEHATDLQMLTHFLRDSTQTNAREVVDRETSVLRVVHREHSATGHLDLGVLEPLRDGFETHALRHFIEQDLDEDTGTRGRILFGEPDAVEDIPGDSVGRKEVTEEPRDIPETICLVAMDGLVVLAECLLKAVKPDAVQPAEAFANEAVERRVRTLLRATLDNHVTELNL